MNITQKAFFKQKQITIFIRGQDSSLMRIIHTYPNEVNFKEGWFRVKELDFDLLIGENTKLNDGRIINYV